MAAHDGFTLQDLVSYRSKCNLPNGEDNRDGSSDEVSWNNGAEGPTADADVEAHRRHDIRALLATLMVSRGTPMLTAGDEFGRTQHGNNNAYAQDNETTWLDWNNTDDDLIEFVSKLAGLRRSHRALSDDRFLTGAAIDDSGIPDARWLTPDGREISEHDWNQPSLLLLGLSLYAAPIGTLAADRICIWVNRGVMDMAASLPAPRPGLVWRIAVDSSKSTADIAPTLSDNRMTVPARAIVVAAETADIRSRRSAKADDELIDRLATAAGIQPEWWQLDGTHHRVTPETKRALLKAMRQPVETASEATEMLIELQRERDSRCLPVSALLAAGSPGTVRLAMPEQHGDRAICLTVKLEDGGTRRLQFARG